MIKVFSILTFSYYLLTSCNLKSSDLDTNDYIDHWEVTKTFKSYKYSSLIVDTVENRFKIVAGKNHVFIISVQRRPIFKEGKEITDLFSEKSLLIELDKNDNFITPQTLGNSKIYKKSVAFSPNHGIRQLAKNEKISFEKKSSSNWMINSQIEDFVFTGEFNFLTNQSLEQKSEQ